jgi:hypothetical protein
MYDYLREGIGYRQGEKENKIKKRQPAYTGHLRRIVGNGDIK